LKKKIKMNRREEDKEKRKNLLCTRPLLMKKEIIRLTSADEMTIPSASAGKPSKK